MKVKRTQHEHFYNDPTLPRLKNAGQVRFLNEEDIERVYFRHGSICARFGAPQGETWRSWWDEQKAVGGFTTWGAKYEVMA